MIVKSSLRRVSVDGALDGVFGICPANDVTARDLQKSDVQFTRAKSFDTFCPLGPFLETEFAALDSLELATKKNGVVVQHGNTRDMAFSIATLLAYISEIMTLCPGYVVLTGTPEGVGVFDAGDVVEILVAGISLSNPVR